MSQPFPNPFNAGFRIILPIMVGVAPFGVVVGTISADIGFTFLETVIMNIIVFAGAAQLAAMDLMSKHAASLVIIATGLVINLRFLLYSAALSPFLREAKTYIKVLCAQTMTDQSYAVMLANESRLPTRTDAVKFYLGSALCMSIVWHSSVILGYSFGNIAPADWALDYAVPLSFISLVIPTLKTKKHFTVALFSAVLSVFLYDLPFRLGLLVTAFIAIGFAALITQKRVRA